MKGGLTGEGDGDEAEGPADRNPLLGHAMPADTLNNVASLLTVAQTAIAHGGGISGTVADGLFVLLECAVQALEYEVKRMGEMRRQVREPI